MRLFGPGARCAPARLVRAIVVASVVGLVAACGGSTSPTPPAASSTLIDAPTVAPSAAAPPTAAPSTPAPTPTPPAGWQPYTATGWAWVHAFGPDGTVYVVSADKGRASSLVALDQSGTVKLGWPYPIADTMVWSMTVAPNGDVFLVTGGDGGSGTGHLVVLGPDGQPKPGWNVPLKSDKGLLVRTIFGQNGIAYVGVFDTGGLPLGDGRAYAFAADGAAVGGWPVKVAGGMDFVVAPDGSVYLASAGDDLRVVGLGPDGKPLLGWPVTGATGPWLGPDGTVYVAQDKKILAFGPAGVPKTGWRTTALPGSAGEIAFAADASLFVKVYTRSAAGDGTTSYLALDAAGKQLTDWGPYVRPKDTYSYPMYPATVGRSVYVVLQSAADQSAGFVVALGDDGQPKPGWKSGLPYDATQGDSFTVGPDDTAYLAHGGAVHAYTATGDVVAGWPYQVPAGYADSSSVQIAPDGTIYVSSVGSAGGRIVVVGADGQELGQSE